MTATTAPVGVAFRAVPSAVSHGLDRTCWAVVRERATSLTHNEWGDEGGRHWDSVFVQVAELAWLAADARDAG